VKLGCRGAGENCRENALNNIPTVAGRQPSAGLIKPNQRRFKEPPPPPHFLIQCSQFN